MKKTMILLLILSLLLPCFSACGNSRTEDELPVLRIGVYESLSGENALGGWQEVLGMQYANGLRDTVKVGKTTYRVELLLSNNRSDPEKGASTAERLMRNDVTLVLGSYGSAVSMTGGEAFNEAGVPMICASCTNPEVTRDKENVFRICFSDALEGAVMANYAVSRGARTAYLLTQYQDEYSESLSERFREAFEASGGRVVQEYFGTGNEVFTSCFEKAEQVGADVFVCPSSVTAARFIVQDAREFSPSFFLLAGDTWESSAVLDAAAGCPAEICVTGFYDETAADNRAAASFQKGFRAWLESDESRMEDNGGLLISPFSALGYDAYNLALTALAQAGSTDPVAVRGAIAAVSLANAVTGEIVFNENGDARKDMAVIKRADTENGCFAFVKTQTVNLG